jgi:hypothetical protein
MATTGLSDAVLYNLKKTTLPCRNYRISQFPSNKSTAFKAGQTAIYHIPTRGKTYLDGSQTCFEFQVKNISEDVVTLDRAGAMTFIQKVEIYHGSSLLESIQNYNVLATMLLDYQYDASEKVGHSIEWGVSASIVDPLKGEELVALADIADTPVPRTFSVPLISGVIGSLLDKMLPLSLNDSLRVEITFATDANMVGVSASTINWEIDFPLLQLGVVELGDEADAIVRNVAGSTPIVHGTSFRNFAITVPAGTTKKSQQNYVLPARFASLNSILIAPRSEITNGNTVYNVGSRVKAFESWHLKVGGEQFPQREIQSDAETAVELKKVFQSIHTTEGGFSVMKTNFYDCRYGTNAAAADSYKNCYGMGINLSSWQHRSDSINCGCNTLNTQCFISGLAAASSADTNIAVGLELDTFAQFDQLLVLQNGLYEVRF